MGQHVFMALLVSLIALPLAEGKQPPMSFGQKLGRAELKVVADRLALDRQQGKLRLQGHVAVSLGDLRIRAGTVTLQVSREGRPTALEAKGAVLLKHGQNKGAAQLLQLSLDSEGVKSISLRGEAALSLAQPPLSLRGSHIRLEPASGRVSIEKAAVTFSGGRR